MKHNRRAAYTASRMALAMMCAFAIFAIAACSPGGDSSGGGSAAGGSEVVEGADYAQPAEVNAPVPTSSGAETSIDTANVSEGYVCAAATNASRLKFQVTLGEETYNYDMPNDGTPMMFPMNMGNGTYTFRIMQNTDGSNYVEIDATTADVSLSNDMAPFLVPNMFCNYTADSACVAKARELTSASGNQAEAVRDVCMWVCDNVSYDNDKAEELSGGSGYIPDPDQTLASQTGICFDYASLSAAMLRSMGIPTKLVTGYVGENELYHAWIMVYIDGTWHSALFQVDPNTWSRCDVTFASAGASKYTGDASAYTDRYTY